MEQLFYNLSQILGTTIIHSLWQGLLIYGALQLIFVIVLGLSAQKKHNIAMLALLSMVAWFGYTFYTEFTAYNWNPPVSNYNLSDSLTLSLYNTYAATQIPQTTLEGYKMEFFNAIKVYLPYIAILYAAGLLINLFKLGTSWNKIRLIKKALTPNLALQAQVNDISRRMGLRKPVQLNFSTRVDVPCVIGYIKPILLLPVTITTQLNADEVEAILMHELSHIQSNDYLLNVIQQVITVLLFFNPFVVLINRIISTERENRCDDMVVQTTGDPLIYARALLKLEENRHSNLKLALAATGKKYHLLTRIERIMKNQKPTGNFKHIILAIAITAGSIGSISWLNPEIKDGKLILKRTAAKVLDETPVHETVTSSPKSKNHFTIVTDDTTRLTQLVDTGKKKSTIKIVMEDDKGNKKEYTSIMDMPDDARKELVNETLIDQFSADNARSAYLEKVNLELKKLNGKLNDPKLKNKNELKKQIETLQKKSNDLQKVIKNAADLGKMHTSPEWQKKIADITNASIAYSKNFNESEDSKKALEELMKQSMKFSQDFLNSPEWKKYQEDLMKQNQELNKGREDKKPVGRKISAELYNQIMGGSPGYEGFDWYKYINTNESKKQKEMVEKSIAMAKTFYGTMSPEVLNNLENITKKGPLMEQYVKSPEFAKNLEMMTKNYNSPEFKKHVEEVAKSYKSGELKQLGPYFESEEFKKNFAEMNKYYNSAEYKKNLKELNKYYESPEYKQQIEAIIKNQNNPSNRKQETPTKQ